MDDVGPQIDALKRHLGPRELTELVPRETRPERDLGAKHRLRSGGV